jgi:hypothetical protein
MIDVGRMLKFVGHSFGMSQADGLEAIISFGLNRQTRRRAPLGQRLVDVGGEREAAAPRLPPQRLASHACQAEA